MTGDVISQFTEAMRARDIIPPAHIIGDGQVHRADAAGRHGKGDVSYLLYDDDHPCGWFENHRDGQGWETWRGTPNGATSEADRERYRQRVAAAKAQRDADNQRRRADAAARAQAIWQAASPDCGGHAYLAAKHIGPHGARL
jgi:putative DNA primase/helicase